MVPPVSHITKGDALTAGDLPGVSLPADNRGVFLGVRFSVVFGLAMFLPGVPTRATGDVGQGSSLSLVFCIRFKASLWSSSKVVGAFSSSTGFAIGALGEASMAAEMEIGAEKFAGAFFPMSKSESVNPGGGGITFIVGIADNPGGGGGGGMPGGPAAAREGVGGADGCGVARGDGGAVVLGKLTSPISEVADSKPGTV